MVSNRTAANRLNARRSTGPRTSEGKITSSANSLKGGLYSGQCVIAALGESAEDFDCFRAAVAADLDARGVLECELADRVAQLLWRARRIPRYEAAAASGSPLPPHPDEVKPWGGEMHLPVPASVGTAELLARARTRVLTARDAAASASDAADLVRRLGLPDGDAEISNGEALAVLDAVAGVLGWDGPSDTARWAAVLRKLGAKPACCFTTEWTVGLLRRAVGHAAVVVGRELGDVIGAALTELSDSASSAVENLRHHENEERAMAARLQGERERAAARAVFADDAVVMRVARVEGHLSRELDRALTAFARVRVVSAGSSQWVRFAESDSRAG